MAISINWGTKVISIPKADMTLIQETPIEIRELNLNTFRLALKDLEDDEVGMPYTKTHNHNTIVTVGGVTLARVIEILDPYTITFENGNYAVNLVGANSNVADKTNLNEVSVRSANSAGLIQVTSGSGLSEEEHNMIDEMWEDTFGKWHLNPTEKTLTIYRSDNATILKKFNLTPATATNLPVFITRTPVLD